MNIKNKLTFIDLFAGIGGMRLAFESAGFECVFSSEIDRYASKTYAENFGEMPAGDIIKIHAKNIPNHNILVGGFPCQPFSRVGIGSRRKNGHNQAFDDEIKGNLFFEIIRILQYHKPEAFLLENVKYILSIDDKNAINKIVSEIDNAGYDLHYKCINSKNYTSQSRERVFFVGFRKDLNIKNFEFPEKNEPDFYVNDILDKGDLSKYQLGAKTWEYLYKYRNKELGSGFYYSVIDENTKFTRTLTASNSGSNAILVKQHNSDIPRKLTENEMRKLMGFPDWFKITSSYTQTSRQFGNSVVVR